jgi:hypothetical protein
MSQVSLQVDYRQTTLLIRRKDFTTDRNTPALRRKSFP